MEEPQETLNLSVTSATERAISHVTVPVTRTVNRSVTTVTEWDTLLGHVPVRGPAGEEGLERTDVTPAVNPVTCPAIVRAAASV